MAGFIDFPLYDADNRTGYIPAANQSGSFLNSRDYAVNAEHMGTADPFIPGPGLDILLVGDSIVWGGNPYREPERLAPQLRAATGAQVWPISAGSWSLVNELNYLEDHPEVVAGSDRIVFVLNSGDFSSPSSWRDELYHPRGRPVSALYYYAQKYLLKPQAPPTPAELVVPAEDPFAKLATFLATCSCEADFWLYPTKAELEDSTGAPAVVDMGVDLTTRAGAAPERVHLVQDISGWDPDLYKDTIHPTPAGFGVLAQGIAATLPAEERAAALPAGE
ncbi:hypothetical protein GVY41_07950 [Frigidibacter albus]|uniref:SGNH hydrolase-type esterase domain-containing protein n=1 Tax=Frigidibacter albus TaxID=1465486 RepID=A0A6L8VFJ1_9RHOB|nr:hypothetical protein [Frigidibacter albus]MZQ89013.1 hypothetical protein [Frigidibacter albus]NBE30930.1 hypothetical protein [Frigidibacter albus]GGH51939.1 hypothetical protein GCM10011341_15960 [Frigidibacter albus]